MESGPGDESAKGGPLDAEADRVTNGLIALLAAAIAAMLLWT